MERPRILILGKLPPPLIGPALATEIILNSELKGIYELKHFDTSLNRDVSSFGKVSLSKVTDIQAMYRRFRQVLKSFKPDLVLIPIGQTSAGFFKDVPFIRLAAISKAKVLVHLRGSAFKSWYQGLDLFRKKMVAKNLSKADGAIVLGSNLTDMFSDFFSAENIHVVPNGADYDFPPRTNSNLQITYIANYLPGKGIKQLLQALLILNQKDDLPSFEFRAHGSWDDMEFKKECQDLARGHNNLTLGDSISGSSKWNELANSDVFVFTPNHPEGHPWSIIEASAAGLPIVSTDRGAICQNVIDGENGFLLKDPIPEQIAEKLTTLLRDKELRMQMANASRSLYKEKFTAAAMVNDLDNVFKSTLDICVES